MGLRVIKSGILASIQDYGRIGYTQKGIPQCGVMDSYSMTLLNILLGNAEAEAVIEMNIMGAEYEFLSPIVFAIGGAVTQSFLNDEPIYNYKTYYARSGDRLKIGLFQKGCRAYLGVQGGFLVPEILGSKSTDIKLGIGGFLGRKLQDNDIIELHAESCVSIKQYTQDCKRHIQDWLAHCDLQKPICVILGPQSSHFSTQGIDTFLNTPYRISTKSDRMGMRCEGQAIEHSNKGADIITDATTFGAIQVPKNGQPIILMAERQTSGGYAKIACVISTNLARLSQMPPNSTIRFQSIDIQSAQAKLIAQQQYLHTLKQKLHNP